MDSLYKIFFRPICGIKAALVLYTLIKQWLFLWRFIIYEFNNGHSRLVFAVHLREGRSGTARTSFVPIIVRLQLVFVFEIRRPFFLLNTKSIALT